MKYLTLRVAAKPKSFRDVKFTEDEWTAAAKKGEVTLPHVTAMEALQHGKGVYEVKPEEREAVDVKIGGLTLEAMSNDELKLMLMRSGVTIRKKNLQRKDMLALLRKKLDEIIVVDDDDGEEDEGDDESPEQESSDGQE